jgi:hypothetical protein
MTKAARASGEELDAVSYEKLRVRGAGRVDGGYPGVRRLSGGETERGLSVVKEPALPEGRAGKSTKCSQ